MEREYKRIKSEQLEENIFDLIANKWGLLLSGNIENYNMMTISWGMFGELWHKKVACVFIRPQRYTFDFVENNENFTIMFFDNKYKHILEMCGSKSGRDINKMNIKELTIDKTENNSIFFKQANIIIECKKIYYDDLKKEHFLDNSINENYPKEDYHRFFIGEIISIMKKNIAQ